MDRRVQGCISSGRFAGWWRCWAGSRCDFSLGDAVAGNFSSGHRFLGKSKDSGARGTDYVQKLKANFVLVRPEDRKKKIEGELRRLASGKGLRIHEDAHLMDLVTYLNEYPTAILGGFDPAYLELPDEILITVMRDHQKYFALERKNGALAPNFLAVINLDKDRAGLIRAGHERVLRARFADARFFWETDQKCRLADYLPKLGAVTYQEKLGSYGEKVERMRELARWLSEQWFASGIAHASVGAADRAAELSKCDLVTEMVREFTELQGIVGGLYAKSQGEPEEVAWAVYDQYKPAGLEDSIPRNITGQALALADKLDSLVGCFAVGLIPSGSSDPFALRRAAIGIVKILVETKLPVSLSMVIARSARTLRTVLAKIAVSAGVEKQVLGISPGSRAIRSQGDAAGWPTMKSTPRLLPERMTWSMPFAAWRRSGPSGKRRTSSRWPSRSSASGKSSKRPARRRVGSCLPCARICLQRMRSGNCMRCAASAMKEVEQHKRAGRYREALQDIAALRPAVDRFFDDVMVMAEDEQIRKNRLTLLSGLLSEFSTIADFSEIVTAEQGK